MKRFGFTLIEVLVTILIFSILVTLTSVVYQSALARSRDHQRLSNLQTIANALEQFYVDHKEYPNMAETGGSPQLFISKFQLEEFPACTITNTKNGYLTPKYLTEVPEDPQRRFVVSTVGGVCSDANNQNGEYLYAPYIKSAGLPTEPVKSFWLMAKVERKSNMSTARPTNQELGYYATHGLSQFVFCTAGSYQPPCTQNYYLKSAKN